jgi:hypothetical protein
MSPRAIATVYALGRVVIGTALTVAPRTTAATWVGGDAERTSAQLLTSALGIRDLGLGAGTIVALRRGGDTRPWLQASAAADFVDFVATVRGRRDIPGIAVLTVGAVAAGSAGLGAWLSTQLD